MQALAAERGLFLSVYHNRRWDGDFQHVQQIVRNGQLGSIHEATLHFDRYRTGFSGKAHKEGNELGAGVLHDLGPHIIDQALLLFGVPTSIFCDVMTLRNGGQSNDYFEALFFFADRPDLRVRLHSTVIAREASPAYIVHGRLGSLTQNRSDPQERLLAAGVKVVDCGIDCFFSLSFVFPSSSVVLVFYVIDD
jgi:scyllo-inositol 2-dehydrogenase (NADP+)